MAEQATATEPPWLRIARSELGVREIAGGPNERIGQYLATVGGKPGDEWCAAFMSFVMQQAGIEHPGKRAAAAWRRWGQSCAQPRAGTVVVLYRGTKESWTRHVTLCLSATEKTLLCIGGNQGNAVSIKRYPLSRVDALRWPK